jgi:Na+/proline symporter
MLWTLRLTLVGVSVLATTFAVNSQSTMYEMVESGYKVTLVTAFVPLLLGIYWSKASTQGAVFSLLFAVPVWIAMEYQYDEESAELWRVVPPQIYGFLASLTGMILGSLLPPFIKPAEGEPEDVAHRRAPAGGH